MALFFMRLCAANFSFYFSFYPYFIYFSKASPIDSSTFWDDVWLTPSNEEDSNAKVIEENEQMTAIRAKAIKFALIFAKIY
jgi:hypothetical protein